MPTGNGQLMKDLRNNAKKALKRSGLSDEQTTQLKKIRDLPSNRDYTSDKYAQYQGYVQRFL